MGHNRSGTNCVVVVDMSCGNFKEVHNLGITYSEEEAVALEVQGRHWTDT